MVRIHQRFPENGIKDVSCAVLREIEKAGFKQIIKPKDSVAIAVGSRGIANLATIVGSLVRVLKEIGCNSFIVPAMGSHGGGTAEGQRMLLRHFGASEERLGIPIKSSMEVINTGVTSEGFPVYLDRNAAKADYIIPVNRIKPHTDFNARIESGLMKMVAVGLGKQIGAEACHKLFLNHGHYKVIVSLARELIRQERIGFGIAVLENRKDETALIKAIPGEDIEKEEESLLNKARNMLAKLPFDEIDLLIVDRIGKEISGTGMDQNVIGRTVSSFSETPDLPRIKRIFVRDLSDETMGNAVGIGNADFTTQRLVKSIDLPSTYLNCLTGYAPELARIPCYYQNDRLALNQALNCIGPVTADSARIVHIRDTLNLEVMEISDSLIPEIKQNREIEISGQPFSLKFDISGNLC